MKTILFVVWVSQYQAGVTSQTAEYEDYDACRAAATQLTKTDRKFYPAVLECTPKRSAPDPLQQLKQGAKK